MAKVWVRIVVAAILVVLADYLVYGYYGGCGLTIFSLVLAAFVFARYHARTGRVVWWLVVWTLVALGGTLQRSTTGAILLITLGWAIVAMACLPRERALLLAMIGGIAGGAIALVSPIVEYSRFVQLRARAGIRKYRPLWVYVIPAAVIGVFAILLVPANLVTYRLLNDFLRDLTRWLQRLSPDRVFFWCIVGLSVFGVLRFRPLRVAILKARGALPAAPNEWRASNELKAAIATFVGLNVLFLAINALDLAYLWFAALPPGGMTYSEYAHHGSYRLIWAVVLSGITVSAFFRVTAAASRNTAARVLGYFFALQNLVVLAGAARRLEIYVEAYGLTRFRLATFIWMVIVVAGFILTVVKMRRNLPFYFLLRTNAVSVVLILSAVALVDTDGFIARWNVSMYERGIHKSIDVRYLGELGVPALPAVARLAQAADSDTASRARETLRRLAAAASEDRAHWQSWTLRDYLAVRDAAEKWDVLIPDPQAGPEVAASEWKR